MDRQTEREICGSLGCVHLLQDSQSIVSSPLLPDGVPKASEPDCGASSEQDPDDFGER